MTDKKAVPPLAVVASKVRDQNEVAGSTFGSLRRSCFRSERVCMPSCQVLPLDASS